MNKIMLVGRIVRDPETQSTQSGIKYSRFSIAVDRPFSEDQTDFIPIVAWRNQASFIESYLKKGSLISIEGRFTSSRYTNSENQQVTRYEVTAERVNSLESRAQREAREASTREVDIPTSATATQVMKFAEENKPDQDEKKQEDWKNVPWDIDL